MVYLVIVVASEAVVATLIITHATPWNVSSLFSFGVFFLHLDNKGSLNTNIRGTGKYMRRMPISLKQKGNARRKGRYQQHQDVEEK